MVSAALLACHDPHPKRWDYSGGPGVADPEHWGDVPGDALCGTGKRQSPIALAMKGGGRAGKPERPALSFDYLPSPLTLENTGHTLQVDYQPGSWLASDWDSYRLVQFHFHAPSEHTLDGRHFPLEIHFVHLDAKDRPKVVVAVFAQEGADNPALDDAVISLPTYEGQKVEPTGGTVDAAKLIPAEQADFAYDGSLTTPPCTEGVHWHVMTTPIEVSRDQLAALLSLRPLHHNNRPLQPGGAD